MKFDRSKIPTPTVEESFNLPSAKRLNLDNSLRLVFIEKKDIPIVRVNLVINAGSIFDPPNKKGVSNLLTMCLDEGAGTYDSLELSEQFDMLGARFSMYSNSDNIHITLQTLKENFDKALELLGLIIIEPHLNEEDFERERRKTITKIKQLSDDPSYIAATSFEKVLFGEMNSYSFPSLGKEEDIVNISNEDIKSFYKKYILPINSFMVVTGNISEHDLIASVNKSFSGWKKNRIALSTKYKFVDTAKKIYIVNKQDSVQTEIRTGHLTSGRNSPDYFSKHILNSILGGQFNSRINHNLREKNGYTYGAGSNFNYYMKSAYFAVSTSVAIDNTTDALREIFYELSEIQKGITKEELEFAKSSIVRKFPANFETYRQVASNIIGQVIFNLPEDYFNTYLYNIKSVLIDDVNNSAVNHIHPEKTITVLVGDKEKIIQKLRESELGEAVFL